MARPTKVPNLLTTLLSIPMLMSVYLFPCKIGTNLCVKILGNKKLPTLVDSPHSSFPKDWQLYQQEIFPEIILQILQLVILSEMVCLSIFNGRVVTYVCLTNPTHGS